MAARSISYDEIVLTKVIVVEFWDHGDMSTL